MTAILAPARPITATPTPEYDCWDGVPQHIRNAVAQEYTWEPDRHGHPRDRAGLCPAQRAASLLALGPEAVTACRHPHGAAVRLGTNQAAWHRFMFDLDLGRIGPSKLAAAIGAS